MNAIWGMGGRPIPGIENMPMEPSYQQQIK